MNSVLGQMRLSVLLLACLSLARPAAAQLLIVGNDEKVSWDDGGKLVLAQEGKDTVSILDINSPLAPKIVASLPLTNSAFAPPGNPPIHPNHRPPILPPPVTHLPLHNARPPPTPPH